MVRCDLCTDAIVHPIYCAACLPGAGSMPPELGPVRPVVAWLAQLIEADLARYDHHHGWDDTSPATLAAHVSHSHGDLIAALGGDDRRRVVEAAVAVATHAMQVADRCSLAPSSNRGRNTPPASRQKFGVHAMWSASEEAPDVHLDL